MYRIRKSVELDAGHRVPFHASKCCHLHGHRYRVTAIVEAPETVPAEGGRSEAGMVMDFGVIKQVLMEEVHDPYDHKLILWENDPSLKALRGSHPMVTGSIVVVPCIPTAEELARFWAGAVDAGLRRQAHQGAADLRLIALEVMETPTSFATYEL